MNCNCVKTALAVMLTPFVMLLVPALLLADMRAELVLVIVVGIFLAVDKIIGVVEARREIQPEIYVRLRQLKVVTRPCGNAVVAIYIYILGSINSVYCVQRCADRIVCVGSIYIGI